MERPFSKRHGYLPNTRHTKPYRFENVSLTTAFRRGVNGRLRRIEQDAVTTETAYGVNAGTNGAEVGSVYLMYRRSTITEINMFLTD